MHKPALEAAAVASLFLAILASQSVLRGSNERSTRKTRGECESAWRQQGERDCAHTVTPCERKRRCAASAGSPASFPLIRGEERRVPRAVERCGKRVLEPVCATCIAMCVRESVCARVGERMSVQVSTGGQCGVDQRNMRTLRVDR